jgi:DNA-binding GntR family transcriptional regulator
MPVREALRKLENDGLLEIIPFRGAFVRHLSLVEVRDVYEARQAVEGMAAFLAAKRGVTAKLRDFRIRLEASLKHSKSADLRKVQRDGAAFHTAIVEASANARLLTIVTSLRSEIALTLRMALEHEPKRISDTVAEHLRILDAIESGDAAESRDRMVAHLAAGLDSRMRIFRSVR